MAAEKRKSQVRLQLGFKKGVTKHFWEYRYLDEIVVFDSETLALRDEGDFSGCFFVL